MERKGGIHSHPCLVSSVQAEKSIAKKKKKKKKKVHDNKWTAQRSETIKERNKRGGKKSKGKKRFVVILF